MFNIKDGEISIGDKLRVRQWDDMVSEYGYLFEDVIMTPYLFTRNMEYLCGKEFEVAGIAITTGLPCHYVSDNEIEGHYIISAEILEPAITIDETDFDEGSDEDFFRMIGVKWQ